MIAAVLTMKSPLYEGPVTRLLGGMDLSWVLGIAVSATTYLLIPSSLKSLQRSRLWTKRAT